MEITIEKLVAGGLGLGRLPDGMVALVPLVLPGEKVRIAPLKRRKQYVEGRLLELLAPSPLRTHPECLLFGRCGGCDLQHTGAASQLRLKEEILREILIRGGMGQQALETCMEPPVAAPSPFGYRQRIRLRVDFKGRWGYYRHRSHKVEPLEACPLAHPEINKVLARLKGSEPMRRLLPHTGAMELLLSPADGAVAIVLHFDRKPRATDRNLAIEIEDNVAGIKNIFLSVPGYGMSGPFRKEKSDGNEKLLRFTMPLPPSSRRITLTFEPGGFCQVNLAQNEKLVQTLLSWADVGPGERGLDLFCGMGNFSLPLALKAKEVVGMDLQGSAIRSAKRNALQNDIANCRFEKKSGLDGLKTLLARGERFDFVLLDPPRQGCGELIPLLPGLGAGRIIYISCDPATLARDLTGLRRNGYAVRRMMLVDMFPQTHHMETITLLDQRACGPPLVAT